jgi:hypothetical protein
LKVPSAVGVPEIVITLPDQEAVTPAGKPDAVVSIPVAPVVAIVIFVNGLPASSVGLDEGLAAVLVTQVTVIVPVAFTLPQPPVKRIV